MNGSLDINTERGRIAAADQAVAIKAVLRSAGPSFFAIHTDDTGSAAIDCLICHRSGLLHRVAEVKTRYDLTIEKFESEFRNEWLISNFKLESMRQLARLLNVPASGILYLKDSQLVLFQQIFDSKGNATLEYFVEGTQTQATCNGGTAHRLNAFIPMAKAQVIDA